MQTKVSGQHLSKPSRNNSGANRQQFCVDFRPSSNAPTLNRFVFSQFLMEVIKLFKHKFIPWSSSFCLRSSAANVIKTSCNSDGSVQVSYTYMYYDLFCHPYYAAYFFVCFKIITVWGIRPSSLKQPCRNVVFDLFSTNQITVCKKKGLSANLQTNCQKCQWA